MASASTEVAMVCKAEATSTSGPSSATVSRQFCTKPALLEVLKLAGAQGETFSLKEVLYYLINYINSRRLYVRNDPKKIVCENDPLEKAFGVKTFMLNDVLGLLSNNIYLVATAEKGEGSSASKGALPLPCATRKRSLELDEFVSPSPKMHCPEFPQLGRRPLSPMFIELARSPQYDSSSETVFSYQDYETSVVKDSSDDLWFLETEDEFEVEIESDDLVEFEVASLSSSASGDYSDTESEVAEMVGAAMLLSQNDSDVEFWADTSDNDGFIGELSDTDPEIPDADKWQCQYCKALNNPVVRFCQKCWKVRYGWLPERRHRGRHPRLKRTRSFPNHNTQGNLSSNRRRRLSRSLPNVSVAELLESGDDAEKEEPGTSDNNQILSDDRESGSQETSPVSSQEEQAECSSINASQSMCSICLIKPKNASIIHGRTGHQICCYGCGKKLWERNKPCPVCRRTIQKVGAYIPEWQARDEQERNVPLIKGNETSYTYQHGTSRIYANAERFSNTEQKCGCEHCGWSSQSSMCNLLGRF